MCLTSINAVLKAVMLWVFFSCIVFIIMIMNVSSVRICTAVNHWVYLHHVNIFLHEHRANSIQLLSDQTKHSRKHWTLDQLNIQINWTLLKWTDNMRQSAAIDFEKYLIIQKYKYKLQCCKHDDNVSDSFTPEILKSGSWDPLSCRVYLQPWSNSPTVIF